MKGNRISRDNTAALTMAGALAGGMAKLETELGLRGLTAAELKALIETCTDADAAVGVAKADRQAASRTLQTADDDARAFLTKTKSALAVFLGPRWHAGWAPTGFPNQSTMIPKRQEIRWLLCNSLQRYYTAHPEQEAALLDATAAKAGAHHAAVRQAHTAFAQATTKLGQLLKARDAAYVRLRKNIRYAIFCLAKSLPDDDPRWHRFGLNAPADPHVPERVASLELKAVGQGSVEVSWARASRATRYRLYVQRHGQDSEPIPRKPVADTRALLTGFRPGTRVRIHILAANATGEAAPSPVEEVMIQ